MCVFNVFLMGLGVPDFSRFGHNLLLENIFLVARENECWIKLFSDSHNFFYFLLQRVSLRLFHQCPRRFCQSTFSTDTWWYFKRVVFSEKYTLSLASFQLEHPFRMQA